LLIDLHSVNICYLALHHLYGLCLVDAADMDIYDDIAVHFQKIRKNPVVQFRGKNLQDADSPDFAAHAKVPAIPEMK
jgi:hypothetical protein